MTRISCRDAQLGGGDVGVAETSGGRSPVAESGALRRPPVLAALATVAFLSGRRSTPAGRAAAAAAGNGGGGLPRTESKATQSRRRIAGVGRRR